MSLSCLYNVPLGLFRYVGVLFVSTIIICIASSPYFSQVIYLRKRTLSAASVAFVLNNSVQLLLCTAAKASLEKSPTSHHSPEQQLLQKISYKNTLRLSAHDLMICAALNGSLLIGKGHAQISYGQKASRAHTLSRKAGANDKKTEVSKNWNKTHNHKFTVMSNTLLTKNMETISEHTGNEPNVHTKYPHNLTCKLRLLPRKWKKTISVVKLKKRSQCVPGNFVTIDGAKFKYTVEETKVEKVTWTGCEGPQDPLGHFMGRRVHVGFTISQFDVPYDVTVEVISNRYSFVRLTIGHQLNSYNLMETFGGCG